jgi:hypothetical protein
MTFNKSSRNEIPTNTNRLNGGDKRWLKWGGVPLRSAGRRGRVTFYRCSDQRLSGKDRWSCGNA